MPTRDQVFTRAMGTPPPTIEVDQRNSGGIGRAVNQPNHNVAVAEAALAYPGMYVGLNVSIWKAFLDKTNQGFRASRAQRAVMMIDPRDNPARSQIGEAYFAPVQLFASSNTWQTPAGSNSRGKRAAQPSLKFVSPYSAANPIPTKMPWDL